MWGKNIVCFNEKKKFYHPNESISIGRKCLPIFKGIDGNTKPITFPLNRKHDPRKMSTHYIKLAFNKRNVAFIKKYWNFNLCIQNLFYFRPKESCDYYSN